jgi:hypothetical protein
MKENPDAETKHAIIETKVARPANRRVGNAGSIEIVGDVKDENKWKQPKRNLASGVFRRGSCDRCNRA